MGIKYNILKLGSTQVVQPVKLFQQKNGQLKPGQPNGLGRKMGQIKSGQPAVFEASQVNSVFNVYYKIW